MSQASRGSSPAVSGSANVPAQVVDVVVYPGFKAMEAIGPLTVFNYANLLLGRQGRGPAYTLRIAATTPGTVPSDTFMALDATQRLSAQEVPDVAVIVGTRHIEAAIHDNPGIVAWARATAPRLKRLIALCSGSFFLAEAGLLDGRPATTHWSVAALLERRYPAVQVTADAIFTRHENLWTSAGVTAGIDLALAVVEDDLGRDVALEVARELVVYLKRPGGQSQFSLHLASETTTHPGIRRVQEWVLAQPAHPHAVPEMAARAAMSERNFRRVFHKEIGQSPMIYVETARLEAARRQLETSDLPLKTIAQSTGFGSDERLRRAFLRHVGITPREYRERFASALGGCPR